MDQGHLLTTLSKKQELKMLLRSDAEAQRGCAALPTSSRGDVFLDFEGDPFAFDQGLEYLIGTVTSRDAESGDGATGRCGDPVTRLCARRKLMQT